MEIFLKYLLSGAGGTSREKVVSKSNQIYHPFMFSSLKHRKKCESAQVLGEKHLFWVDFEKSLPKASGLGNLTNSGTP